MKIHGSGTIIANRVTGLQLNNTDKMERGTRLEHVSGDKKLVIVEWKDRETVLMASNCCGIEPKVDVRRWAKQSHAYNEISCPAVVRQYNQCMGGVDICDQRSYRT